MFEVSVPKIVAPDGPVELDTFFNLRLFNKGWHLTILLHDILDTIYAHVETHIPAKIGSHLHGANARLLLHKVQNRCITQSYSCFALYIHGLTPDHARNRIKRYTKPTLNIL